MYKKKIAALFLVLAAPSVQADFYKNLSPEHQKAFYDLYGETAQDVLHQAKDSPTVQDHVKKEVQKHAVDLFFKGLSDPERNVLDKLVPSQGEKDKLMEELAKRSLVSKNQFKNALAHHGQTFYEDLSKEEQEFFNKEYKIDSKMTLVDRIVKLHEAADHIEKLHDHEKQEFIAKLKDYAKKNKAPIEGIRETFYDRLSKEDQNIFRLFHPNYEHEIEAIERDPHKNELVRKIHQHIQAFKEHEKEKGKPIEGIKETFYDKLSKEDQDIFRSFYRDYEEEIDFIEKHRNKKQIVQRLHQRIQDVKDEQKRIRDLPPTDVFYKNLSQKDREILDLLVYMDSDKATKFHMSRDNRIQQIQRDKEIERIHNLTEKKLADWKASAKRAQQLADNAEKLSKRAKLNEEVRRIKQEKGK